MACLFLGYLFTHSQSWLCESYITDEPEANAARRQHFFFFVSLLSEYTWMLVTSLIGITTQLAGKQAD
jgi:hypothetical protein